MMKLKPIATLTLLVLCIIAACLIFSGRDRQTLSAEQSAQTKSSTEAQPAEAKTTSQDDTASEHTIAYYFHGNRRCPTCLKIEAYTAQALNEKFVEELKTRKLEWRSIDISLSENQHFVNDYQLYAQSVILSAVQDGKQTKWKNLDKVWRLVRNKQEFFSYIQTETADFMKD